MPLGCRNVAHFGPGRMIILPSPGLATDHLEQHRVLVLEELLLRLRGAPDPLELDAERLGVRGGVEVEDPLDVAPVVGPPQDAVGPNAVLLAEPLVLVEGCL